MPLIKSSLTCLISLCFLLLSGACEAALSDTLIDKEQLIYAEQLASTSSSITETNGSVLFNIPGFYVHGLIDPKTNKIAIIYLFPNSSSTSGNKVKLQQAAVGIQIFFQVNTEYSSIEIPSNGSFAQIILDETTSSSSLIVGDSTANAILQLNHHYGAPKKRSGNYIIWYTPFNNNKSAFELALDISQEKVDYADLIVKGANVKNEDLIEETNSVLCIWLRESKSAQEAKSWASYTNFQNNKILAASMQSSFQSSSRTSSNSLNEKSIFLIKKDDHMRLGTAAILKRGNTNASTWPMSAPVSYPKKAISTAKILAQVEEIEKTQQEIANQPSQEEPSIPDSIPDSEPITTDTPAIVLERYIKQLGLR